MLSVTSTRNSRRAEKRRAQEAEFDRQAAEREKEAYRKAALPMYLRIEEADVNEDVKDILHRFAATLGLE
jgi:hypothetical protein